MKFNFLFIFLIISVTCFSQKILISDEETNRQLKWSDFSGTPDRSSSFFALTHWNIKYSFEDVNVKGDSVDLKNLDIVLQFNPDKSWVKEGKQTDELLIHEQVHFDIGKLCLKEAVAAFQNRMFHKSEVSAAVQKIFKSVLDKYYAMQQQYDMETNHSINKQEQHKWNTLVAQKLQSKQQ